MSVFYHMLSRFILVLVLAAILTGCEKSPEEARKELISRGATVEQQTFIDSARAGNNEVVELFVISNRKKEKTPLYEGPLVAASEAGNVEIVKTLLEAGADPNVDDGSPLRSAVAEGNAGVCSALLEAGADPNLDEGKALEVATRQGREDIVRSLLESGADPSSGGSQSIVEAITSEREDIALRLIRNVEDYNRSRIFEKAAINGLEGVVKEVLGSEFDPEDSTIRKAAIRSVDEGNPEIAILLYKEFKEIKGLKKWQLVGVAAAEDTETLESLTDANFPLEPSTIDPSFNTPLVNAIKKRHYQNAKILIDKGANINYHVERLMSLKEESKLSSKSNYSLDSYTWKNDPLLISFCRGEWSMSKLLAEEGASFRTIEQALQVYKKSYYDTVPSLENFVGRQCRRELSSIRGRRLINEYSKMDVQ